MAHEVCNSPFMLVGRESEREREKEGNWAIHTQHLNNDRLCLLIRTHRRRQACTPLPLPPIDYAFSSKTMSPVHTIVPSEDESALLVIKRSLKACGTMKMLMKMM